MQLLFMGTGAADWNISERKNGEFFRRRTSVMINNDLIIDFNGETPDFFISEGKNISNVANILITHTHSDHFSAETINEFFYENTSVWIDDGAAEKAEKLKTGVKIIPLYEKFHVGKYTVVAAEANHSVGNTNEKALNYIISDGEKTIFWGCDGAWFLNRTWHEIRKYKFDLFVFDGTLGDDKGDYRIFEHNNLNMIKEMAETVKKLNLMKQNSKIMISHMSKYSQYPHEKLEKYLKQYGIQPAYDGLLLDI